MPRSLVAAVSARASQLRYSFLVLPGLIAVALGLLGVAVSQLDRFVGDELSRGLFPGGPSAARDVLSTIAASLITVAGVTFSITVVSLQLVSQQFTPRALRNFLGDRLNQLVAGVFVGVFLYCIAVLRSIEADGEELVNGVGVTLGVVLAFVALLLLLVFINHMAQSIQVSSIAARVARRTLQSVERLYPGSYGEPGPENPAALVRAWREEAAPALVYARRPGFVQSIDHIPDTISGRGFRVELLVAPGDFVTEKHPLAAVWTDRDPESCVVALRRAIAVGTERDPEQDVGYGVRQLADIAVRALSPSVNDPTTATTCIGYLQAVLERLAETAWPRGVRHFPEQDVTAVLPPDDFRTYAESLVQIGRYAQDARVVEALLRATLRVAQAAAGAGHEEPLRVTVEAAGRIARRALAEASLDEVEREAVAEELESVEAVARPVPSPAG